MEKVVCLFLPGFPRSFASHSCLSSSLDLLEDVLEMFKVVGGAGRDKVLDLEDKVEKEVVGKKVEVDKEQVGMKEELDKEQVDMNKKDVQGVRPG